MRQREVFELRISTRVARRDHCELTEICAGGDKTIGKRDRKNYLLGSRAERLRDTESVKTLMAALSNSLPRYSLRGGGERTEKCFTALPGGASTVFVSCNPRVETRGYSPVPLRGCEFLYVCKCRICTRRNWVAVAVSSGLLGFYFRWGFHLRSGVLHAHAVK